jgi:hypothetical protein
MSLRLLSGLRSDRQLYRSEAPDDLKMKTFNYLENLEEA